MLQVIPPSPFAIYYLVVLCYTAMVNQFLLFHHFHVWDLNLAYIFRHLSLVAVLSSCHSLGGGDMMVCDRNWIPTKAWAQVVGVGRRKTEDDARPTASGRRGRARGRRKVGLRGLWRKK